MHPDYHIELKRAYYSVPYRLIGQQVDVRLTASAVEVFHRGKRVAAHVRARERGRRSTREDHRPARHVAVIEQSLTRVLERAAAIGPATVEVMRAHRKHPEETLRSAQGILRLAADFSPAVLELACERALALRSYVGVRAAKLGLHCEQGVDNKSDFLRRYARDEGLRLERTAYIGNDVNDLECLRIVDLPVVVADAHPSIQAGGSL